MVRPLLTVIFPGCKTPMLPSELLPPEDGVFQYRIKNANEPHERMVKEHELRSAA
jgi:hypothetical protein